MNAFAFNKARVGREIISKQLTNANTIAVVVQEMRSNNFRLEAEFATVRGTTRQI